MNIKPILKDNTWREIIWASENNCIPDTWKVGDEIDLVLNGYFNEVVTLQIWDFNHFDKSDGSGKANICFGMKHLMKDKQCMNLCNGNMSMGTWNDSYMKNVVMNDIYESIPECIRSHIKEVNTYANNGCCYTCEEQGLLSKDKVFLPGLTECCSDWSSQNQTETGQRLFPIFSGNNSRIKKLNNGSGEDYWWWTRSPYYYDSSYFCRFNGSGSSSDDDASDSCGVCVCFNI